MRKVILLNICLLQILSASAQLQVGQRINDFYNKAPEIHNMSLIPLNSVPTVSLSAGSSLDGFSNHPMQGTLLCSGFLMDRLGAGFQVNFDKQGLAAKTDVQLGLNYYIYLSKENGGDKFSFALSGHFTQDKIDKNDIIVLDTDDPGLENSSDFDPAGNASAGISVLRENKYYFGLSAHQLLGGHSSFSNPAWDNTMCRHYFAMGSYTFSLSRTYNLDLELNGIAALLDFNSYQWMAGPELKINKMFSVGAGYKSNGALKIDLGLTAQSWSFGYLCMYGITVDASKFSYKGINNMIFIKKVFNEGRRTN